MSETRRVLERAHRRVAAVVGEVSLILSSRRGLGAGRVMTWVSELRRTADDLEDILKRRGT